jgi:hypothetical protein
MERNKVVERRGREVPEAAGRHSVGADGASKRKPAFFKA